MSTPPEPIELLRRRVDSLELVSKEKQKPWYRQPATILSVIALVASLGATVFTQVTSSQETIRSKKEELRKLLIGLVEIRQEYMKSAPSPMSGGSQLLKAKQGVYLQAAERLASEIPGTVSSYEYVLLATEEASDGNYARAENYLFKGADVGATPLQRAQALRILAIGYFFPGPLNNVEKGRAAFAKAIDSLKAESDPYVIQGRCLTYEAWAGMEVLGSSATNAREKTDIARKCYNDLPPNYPGRQQLLDGLETRIKSGAVSQSDSIGRRESASAKVPSDVREVLAKLSSEDIERILANDWKEDYTVLVTGAKLDGQEGQSDRRLVDLSLVTVMSDAEVKAESKKARKRYDYGIRATALYEKTRAVLMGSLAELVAAAKEAQR